RHFRTARHQLLAGAGPAGAQQNSLWRLRAAPWRRRTLGSPHARTLGANDPGRARKIQTRHAPRLRSTPKRGGTSMSSLHFTKSEWAAALARGGRQCVVMSWPLPARAALETPSDEPVQMFALYGQGDSPE